MIRLIVTKADATHVFYVGGEVERTSKSFDLDHPELEAALRAKMGDYQSQSLTYELL